MFRMLKLNIYFLSGDDGHIHKLLGGFPIKWANDQKKKKNLF